MGMRSNPATSSDIERSPVSRLPIGPVAVDVISGAELIDGIVQSALHSSETLQVATINAQFCVLAESDMVFRDCIRRAEFVCADGVSISLAARLLAGAQVERMAGVDLVEAVCSRGAERGLRVFLLGGRPGCADSLAKLLSERYPGIRIAGVASPPLSFEKSASTLSALLDEVRAARPHVVLVALGAPKQELFIDQYLRNLKIPIAVGVGGSFEIITGVTRRASRLVQRLGLEWLYRLCQEPRRLWRRYLLGNPQFLWIMSRYFVFRGRRGQGERFLPATSRARPMVGG